TTRQGFFLQKTSRSASSSHVLLCNVYSLLLRHQFCRCSALGSEAVCLPETTRDSNPWSVIRCDVKRAVLGFHVHARYVRAQYVDAKKEHGHRESEQDRQREHRVDLTSSLRRNNPSQEDQTGEKPQKSKELRDSQ